MNNELRIMGILKKIYCLTFILSSLFVILSTAPTAHAQGVSLGISPPVIQIEAKPPASINAPITIENNGDEPVELQIRLRGFTASPKEDGHVEYYPEKDPRSAPAIFEKIQISENDHPKTSITLAPQEKKNLVMHIGIPKGEPLNDYYFSVVFISKTAQSDAEKPASQTPVGIATNVLLSIGPKGLPKGEIAQFSSPFFVDHGPVPFSVKLKNTGDRVLVPTGEILIKNMFNQIIGRVDLLPVNILAKTTRAIPDGLSSSSGTPSAELQAQFKKVHEDLQIGYGTSPVALWPEEFLLGPYTAQLTVALSDQGPVFRRSIYFFALPLYLLVSIIIGIIVITYLIIRVRRRMKQVK